MTLSINVHNSLAMAFLQNNFYINSVFYLKNVISLNLKYVYKICKSITIYTYLTYR